jgi:hypothetical protein
LSISFGHADHREPSPRECALAVASTPSLCRLQTTSWHGFDALVVDNGLVRATVVPALGGKIASLVHPPTDREWLWRNPVLEPRAAAVEASYVAEHDVGGFDECFPSVAATRFPGGPWAGTAVPDHGEVWALPWTPDTRCDGTEIEVRLTTDGVRFPYRFERSLRLRQGVAALSLAYVATNLSPHPFPFIWSCHPVFQITPGMKLVVPLGEMRVYGAPGDRFGPLGREVAWPLAVDAEGRTWDLSVVPDGTAGMAVKLWSRAPESGVVGLRDDVAGGDLRFRFDPAEVTHLGLWLNYGGWSGVPGAAPYFNLAIEPCIGAQDDLALAVSRFGEHGMLPPLGRRAWRLDVELA